MQTMRYMHISTARRRRLAPTITMRDSRARRVAALKALVRSGRYEPNFSAVAEALLARGVLKSSSSN